MAELQLLAKQIGANERTLRRAVACGMVAAERSGPRRLRLRIGESAYMRAHWQTLSALRRALRTARHVRLAVIFGSFARGDDTDASDLDLAVSFGDRPHLALCSELTEQLSEQLGRTVEVVDFDRVRSSPTLLRDVLRDGRVLVDRDGEWPTISATRAEVERAARRYERKSQADAWQAVLRMKARATKPS